MLYRLLWPVRALLTPFWVVTARLAGALLVLLVGFRLNAHSYEEWQLHRGSLPTFTGDPGAVTEGDFVRLVPPPLHESVVGEPVAGPVDEITDVKVTDMT